MFLYISGSKKKADRKSLCVIKHDVLVVATIFGPYNNNNYHLLYHLQWAKTAVSKFRGWVLQRPDLSAACATTQEAV